MVSTAAAATYPDWVRARAASTGTVRVVAICARLASPSR